MLLFDWRRRLKFRTHFSVREPGAISMDSDLSPQNVVAVLTGPYKQPYTLEKRPIPAPKLGEALIRIDYTGICHGDVYSRDGGGPAPVDPNRPLVGGHEGIGEIINLGSRTGSSGFGIGDVVGVAWRTQVCKTCSACSENAENRCRNQIVTGLHKDGTFQRKLESCVCLAHLVTWATF